MASWKSCGNCIGSTTECKPGRKYACYLWYPIPCPLCGGALSKIMEHKTKIGNEEVIRNYRHCFSCHMEFYEEEE